MIEFVALKLSDRLSRSVAITGGSATRAPEPPAPSIRAAADEVGQRIRYPNLAPGAFFISARRRPLQFSVLAQLGHFAISNGATGDSDPMWSI